MTPSPGLVVRGREGFRREKYHDQEQRIRAQISQLDLEQEWLTQMIRASREVSGGAPRSNSLKLRVDALSLAQSLLREQTRVIVSTAHPHASAAHRHATLQWVTYRLAEIVRDAEQVKADQQRHTKRLQAWKKWFSNPKPIVVPRQRAPKGEGRDREKRNKYMRDYLAKLKAEGNTRIRDRARAGTTHTTKPTKRACVPSSAPRN